jgi:hypothetical protein
MTLSIGLDVVSIVCVILALVFYFRREVGDATFWMIAALVAKLWGG